MRENLSLVQKIKNRDKSRNVYTLLFSKLGFHVEISVLEFLKLMVMFLIAFVYLWMRSDDDKGNIFGF